MHVFITGGIIDDFLRMRCVWAALCGIVLLTQVFITNSQTPGKLKFEQSTNLTNFYDYLALMSRSHYIQLQLFCIVILIIIFKGFS